MYGIQCVAECCEFGDVYEIQDFVVVAVVWVVVCRRSRGWFCCGGDWLVCCYSTLLCVLLLLQPCSASPVVVFIAGSVDPRPNHGA